MRFPARTLTVTAAEMRWDLDDGGRIAQATGSREIECLRCHATHPAITTPTDLGAFMRAHNGATCLGAPVKNAPGDHHPTRAKRAP